MDHGGPSEPSFNLSTQSLGAGQPLLKPSLDLEGDAHSKITLVGGARTCLQIPNMFADTNAA